MHGTSETIAAIATAPGRGAVGIVRLSGPRAFDIAGAIAGPLPSAQGFALRSFKDAQGQLIDQGLVLAFEGPRSFTGEDVVELQGHGGSAVMALLLQTSYHHGARPARPGEFSERAFLNGRMDLAQAEAVADLVNASSAQAARAASRSLEGEFSRQIHRLLEELTGLRVYVEGALDFSDQDVDWLAAEAWQQRLSGLCANLEQLLQQAEQGRRLQDGLVVALVGAPNVGKSTLMNQLAGADVAIVTDIPGTTRDVLREQVYLDGLSVTLVDTAGLRESEDPVEREGIRRTRMVLERAEIALLLTDDREPEQSLSMDTPDPFHGLPPGLKILKLRNKCDLSGRVPGIIQNHGERQLRLSAAQPLGMDLLIAELKQLAGYQHGEGAFSARARHVTALESTLQHVRNAQAAAKANVAAEVLAEELRLAQQALGEVTGRHTTEDLLSAIFGAFCIGK